MKKVMSFCLCAAMLMLAAFNYPTHAKEDERLYLNGKAMSTDQFEEEYCIKQTVVASDELIGSLSDVSLLISDMQYHKGIFSATCLVKDGEEYYQFKESGPLGRGYKESISDSRSVVWGCEAEQKGPEILNFELTYGNYDNHNRYASREITANAALRIYILNKKTIYMFESAIPDELSWIEGLELDLNHHAYRDAAAWLFAFVPPTVDEDYTVEEMLGFNPNEERMNGNRDLGIFWTADVPVRVTEMYAGSQYVYTSLPMGYYTITDASTYNATWGAQFCVNERVTRDGVLITAENPIKYRNVDIRMVCGNSTMFLRQGSNGRIASSSSTNVIHALLNLLSSTVSWWSTGQSIYTLIQSLFDTGATIDLNAGQPCQDLAYNTTAIGVVIPSRYYICNNSYSGNYNEPINLTSSSHYIVCHGDVTTTLNSTGFVNTYGLIRFQWEYNIGFEDEIVRNKSFTKNYTSSHS